MNKIGSKGKCLFCEKTFSKAGINRHLKTHLAKKLTENKPGTSFLLKVEPDPYYWIQAPYFLSLWMNGDTKMRYLDDFLRAIWLECCGHMSAFTDPKKMSKGGGMWDFFEAEKMLSQGRTDEYEKMMEDSRGEIPMGRKTKAALYKGQKLNYEYDFGSTTKLLITVLEAYPFKADKPLLLLSRNEPLEGLCDHCGKQPAVTLCSVCGYDPEADVFFCTKCAKKHEKQCEDFADYSAMPVVNSPRMGVCAYEGGSIDVKRDGVLEIR